MVTNSALASSEFCQGILKALTIAADGVSANDPDKGNVHLWIRHFNIRLNAANALAKAIYNTVIPSIDDPQIAEQLKYAVQEIESAPQKGYGDDQTWIGISQKQDMVYRSVSKNLYKLFEYASYNSSFKDPFHVKGLYIGLKAAMAVLTAGTDLKNGDSEAWRHQFEQRKLMGDLMADHIEKTLMRVYDKQAASALTVVLKNIRTASNSKNGIYKFEKPTGKEYFKGLAYSANPFGMFNDKYWYQMTIEQQHGFEYAAKALEGMMGYSLAFNK